MPTTYPEIYFPIVVQIVIAIAVAGGLIAASTLLGKPRHARQEPDAKSTLLARHAP